MLIPFESSRGLGRFDCGGVCFRFLRLVEALSISLCARSADLLIIGLVITVSVLLIGLRSLHGLLDIDRNINAIFIRDLHIAASF